MNSPPRRSAGITAGIALHNSRQPVHSEPPYVVSYTARLKHDVSDKADNTKERRQVQRASHCTTAVNLCIPSRHMLSGIALHNSRHPVHSEPPYVVSYTARLKHDVSDKADNTKERRQVQRTSHCTTAVILCIPSRHMLCRTLPD
ncbi:hypothetical protein J6590_076361 [Homalodisca vitripennis]|nr:hypothetical protein J6590_076361 [Homalodisca vitripennis]